MNTNPVCKRLISASGLKGKGKALNTSNNLDIKLPKSAHACVHDTIPVCSPSPVTSSSLSFLNRTKMNGGLHIVTLFVLGENITIDYFNLINVVRNSIIKYSLASVSVLSAGL